jgi:serine/threonine-protein kinase
MSLPPLPNAEESPRGLGGEDSSSGALVETGVEPSDSAVEVDRASHHWISRPRILVAIGALGAVAVVVLAILANRVEVPDLTGLDQSSASEAVQESGLSLDETKTEWEFSVNRDFQVVAVQTPAAGETVWRGSQVQLQMQPMSVEVSDVLGLSFSEARDVLGPLGLGIKTEFKDDPVANGWVVLQQSLRPGSTAKAGDDIVLELDVPDIEVPQVVGLTLGAATSALEAIGFETLAGSGGAESEWEVMAQDASAGDRLRYGGTVRLDVLPPLVEVPNVAGLGLSEAEALLEEAGFSVELRPENAEYDWKVQTHSPAGGTQAREGSAVILTLSEPRIVFTVNGNGTRALITWSVPGGSFSIGQENNARLPWTISFPMTSGYKGNLSAQMLNGSSITCTITVNGRVTSQITSTGAYSIASCG